MRSSRWGVRVPPPQPSLTRNLELEEFEQAVRFKNPSPVTVIALANQYLASGRDADGHAYFCERATQVPDRPLFEALCGMFQARIAPTVPLLKRDRLGEGRDGQARPGRRVGWPLSRYLRGLVLAELPERFGRAQQAAWDLEWVLAASKPFPRGVRRAAYVGLSHAYRTLGKTQASQQALAQAGGTGSPPLQTNFSVNARDGFRFTPRELVEVAPGVHVAHGYDFAGIAFIVTGDQVVAIDAGTSEANARAALEDFRKVSDRPIRTIIVTHAHWDHIGGLRAFLAPDTQVIAQKHFAEELGNRRTRRGCPSATSSGTTPRSARVPADPAGREDRVTHHWRYPLPAAPGAWRRDQ